MLYGILICCCVYLFDLKRIWCNFQYDNFALGIYLLGYVLIVQDSRLGFHLQATLNFPFLNFPLLYSVIWICSKYMAQQYGMQGQLSVKDYVYSFNALLLELITRRRTLCDQICHMDLGSHLVMYHLLQLRLLSWLLYLTPPLPLQHCHPGNIRK